MSANQGGSFATLLFAVPLAAIPAMAIFGVPEFAHVSASTENHESDVIRGPRLVMGSESSPDVDLARGDFNVSSRQQRSPRQQTDEYRRRAADLLAPSPRAPRGRSVAETRVLNETPSALIDTDAPRWTGDRTGERTSERTSERTGDAVASPTRPLIREIPTRPVPRPMQTAAIEVAAPLATTTSTTVTPPVPVTDAGLTWRTAAQRLQAIGIDNYRLERATQTNRFLFVALFSPGSDRRIIQRFEAESTEPLEAVEDVLSQVDHWLQHRYAESR